MVLFFRVYMFVILIHARGGDKDSPTVDPSMHPTYAPSLSPSQSPSNNPSNAPTVTLSFNSSQIPSHSPTVNPSLHPTHEQIPSQNPSQVPSNPTHIPSQVPTQSPSQNPSSGPINPSQTTSDQPSTALQFVTPSPELTLTVSINMSTTNATVTHSLDQSNHWMSKISGTLVEIILVCAFSCIGGLIVYIMVKCRKKREIESIWEPNLKMGPEINQTQIRSETQVTMTNVSGVTLGNEDKSIKALQ